MCFWTPLGKWLDGQAGGWCQNEYNELMNLCGDVQFCADNEILKQYPDGLDVDIAFHWDGMGDGILFDVGGDCGQKRITLRVDDQSNLTAQGPLDTDVLSTPLVAGTYLVSYHVDGSDNALFVNGVLADSGSGGGGTPELLDSCGPGFVLSQRMSYWWENAQMGDWLKLAPFFVHVKDDAGTVDTWDFTQATAATGDTVELFEPSGVADPNWNASQGNLTGFATNGSAWDDDVWAGCF
jgi:hypothetical protein